MAAITRVLPTHPIRPLDDYLATGGGMAQAMAIETDPEAVLAKIDRSGLRGRGGAGFPTGRKWHTIRDYAVGSVEAPTVVVNGAEGEPGCFKDRASLPASECRSQEPTSTSNDREPIVCSVGDERIRDPDKSCCQQRLARCHLPTYSIPQSAAHGAPSKAMRHQHIRNESESSRFEARRAVSPRAMPGPSARADDIVSKPGFGAVVAMLQAGIAHHVHEEEHDMFPELREKAADRLAEMDPDELAAKVEDDIHASAK